MHRIYTTGSAAALLLTLAAISAPAQMRATPEAGEGFDNQVCKTAGTGIHQTKVCVSKNGNVHTLARPASVDHMTSEGYTMCYVVGSNPSKIAWDDAYDSSGWGAATASGTAFPLTVTRTSIDNALRLIQKFTWDQARKSLVIEVQIKNLTSSVVLYSFNRLFDADINGTYGDDVYTRTALSVTATEPAAFDDIGGPPGVSLSVLAAAKIFTQVPFYPILPSACSQGNVSTPYQGDLVGRIQVRRSTNLATGLPAGATDTFKFEYKLY